MTTDRVARAVVLLGEDVVGTLERIGESSRFVPAVAWAERAAGSRPVLGQEFEDDPFATHGARQGAPAWFEHLLPEAGGPLRELIARSLRVSETRSLDLLLALGEDLPGAVVVRAADDAVPSVPTRRERVGRAAPDGDRLPLRVSLAGLQFKLSARMGERGLAVAAAGEDGDWIVKFADQRYATLSRNEFLIMSWARLAGLDVPDVRLESASRVEGLRDVGRVVGDEVFAIRRYDRTHNGRIHQEDFAQALGLAPGEAKYTGTNIDSIARVVDELCPQDVDELVRRLVFLVVSGNDDAHAKNWSLWYPDRVRPRLSPAYDLVATHEYYAGTMSLKLAKARRFEEVDRARFSALAARIDLDAEHVDATVVDAVRAQVEAWATIRDRDEMYPALRDSIDRRLTEQPLLRGLRPD